MKRTRFVLVFVPCLLLAGFLLASASSAQDLLPSEDPICEPPISTCRMSPIPLDANQSLAPSILSDSCPDGFTCTCVPSADGGHDCDAQVCLRDRPDPMCEERRTRAVVAVHEVVERFNSCRTTSDCAWIDNSTRCQGACGALVNKRRVHRVSRRLDRIDRDLCGGFGLGECPEVFVDCFVGQVPACIENRCVPLQVPPPPIPRPLEAR